MRGRDSAFFMSVRFGEPVAQCTNRTTLKTAPEVGCFRRGQPVCCTVFHRRALLRLAMLDFVSVDEAHAHIHPNLRALPTKVVPLTGALGRTLAAAVTSPGPLPPFRNSAMDGVALRAADVLGVPTALPLAFEVAVATPERPLPAGACARITTGQPLPPGADAVVPVERTKETDAGVWVMRKVTQGQHVRPAGENMAAGDTVIGSGQVLTPAAVSLLAAVGAAEVTARQRLQAALLGDRGCDPTDGSTGHHPVAAEGAVGLRPPSTPPQSLPLRLLCAFRPPRHYPPARRDLRNISARR